VRGDRVSVVRRGDPHRRTDKRRTLAI
jgi:hypothetical protein